LERPPEGNKKAETESVSAFSEKLAATYSRGVFKTTTIGKTVFDGRVRNGNGSDHSFMATKKGSQKAEFRMQKHELELELAAADQLIKNIAGAGDSLKAAHRRKQGLQFASQNRLPRLRRGRKKRSSRTTD
jgi:hypothetical protein